MRIRNKDENLTHRLLKGHRVAGFTIFVLTLILLSLNNNNAMSPKKNHSFFARTYKTARIWR